MTDINTISKEYLNFIFVGLDHGINSIRESGGPMVTFVMSVTADKKQLTRIVTDRLEDGPTEAEKFIRNLQPTPRLALIAYDGFATVKGERNDAVIVRSFDSAEETGLVFAQRYILSPEKKELKEHGNSALMGHEKNILKGN